MRDLKFIALFLLSLLLFSCDEKEDTQPAIETGSLTDADGNTYKTIKIGSQWWMAENLRVKHFRNGLAIPYGSDSADWAFRTSPAYCIYENGNTQSPAPGLLYNWHASVDTSGLAPAGWHIPSDAEWKTLEMELGMGRSEADKSGWRGSDEAGKLKIQSPEGWTVYHEVWSGNESGFTALAGSCRLPAATFGQPGLFSTGFWWTRSEAPDSEAWYRYLDYKSSKVFRSHESRSYGFSIRCVKD